MLIPDRRARGDAGLQQLAGYLAAAACHFIVWNKRANAVSFSVLTGAPPEAAGSYGAYYAAIDPPTRHVPVPR